MKQETCMMMNELIGKHMPSAAMKGVPLKKRQMPGIKSRTYHLGEKIKMNAQNQA